MDNSTPQGRGRKGGETRAWRLSKAQLSEGARKAAQARWKNHERGTLKATHTGELKIGDLRIPCAVLEDGTRVLSERGVADALGRARSGTQFAKKLAADEGNRVPVFLIGNKLAPFVDDELKLALAEPRKYSDRRGGRPAHGFEATLLPRICDVWLKARDAGVLNESQMNVAAKADLLMRGFAMVGIVALVDEATGYQAERDREELHRILEAYIATELVKWAKRFPDEFYQEMFRLKNWKRDPSKRPIFVGKLTKDVVYSRLPPGVLEELEQKNPVTANGRRRYKHHQWLTEDIGHDHLRNHLTGVLALMRAAPNWPAFMRLLNRAYPRPLGDAG